MVFVVVFVVVFGVIMFIVVNCLCSVLLMVIILPCVCVCMKFSGIFCSYFWNQMNNKHQAYLQEFCVTIAGVVGVVGDGV